eukprot:1145132-Pelagomonas_calceolata.AAC.1
MDSPLQIVHLCLLKRILGVKRTTPNWSGMRECGHEPLQLYWFRAALRFYNALSRSNSTTLSKVLRADVELSSLSQNAGPQTAWLHAQAWTGATHTLTVFVLGSR